MLNLNFQNGQAPALNARNMNAIVETINTILTQIGSPFVFKGDILYANLPAAGNTINDTYYVIDKTCLYTWDGDSWEVSSLSESDYLSIIQQVLNNIAAEYDSASTYAVGDYCIYNERLYRCTTAITSSEAWTAEHWVIVNVTGEVADLKSALDITDNLMTIGVSVVAPEFLLGYCIDKTTGALSYNASDKYAVTVLIKALNGVNYEVTGQNVPTWSSDGWVTYGADGTTVINHGAMPLDLTGATYFRLATYNAESVHSALRITLKRGNSIFTTPQAYGAYADGVHDDTAAIQAAIDSGKRVIFLQGEYIVSAPLVISKPGTILEGENNRSWGVDQQCAQLIGKAATYFDSIIQLTGNAKNCVIKNLYLLGQTYRNVNYGIHFESVEDAFVPDLIIENVVINYFNQGIHIDSTFKSLLTNVRCQNCRSYSFYIAGKLSGEYVADATTITMINCYADGGGYGYYLNRVRYSSLINCAADHITVACYAMQTCSGISLINCGCEATKGVVLFMQGTCNSVSIAGLEIIAPDTLTEKIEDAFISGYGMINMTISGVTIVGDVGRQYDILDKSPEYTSISVLDNSFSPERCADISNGCIKFLFRDKVYSISNSPQFAGQMAITSTGVYIADNNLQWNKIQTA